MATGVTSCSSLIKFDVIVQAGLQGSVLAEQFSRADRGAGRQHNDVARRDLLQAIVGQEGIHQQTSWRGGATSSRSLPEGKASEIFQQLIAEQTTHKESETT